MKELFDQVSIRCSQLTTKTYSTSFSLGIRLLDNTLRNPIYAIYGYVRFADEIVDSFHSYDKKELLTQFRLDTYKAIEDGISLNPILNSFQNVINQYSIDHELIEQFLHSMAMDLEEQVFDESTFKNYILGSAEVVGLMCLQVFCNGDKKEYTRLKPYAMSLGAAFQKVNFLRDLKDDFQQLGRSYFPNVNLEEFNETTKKDIEISIAKDFKNAYVGIKQLPASSRFGVYLAFVYYNALFKRIRNTPSVKVMNSRIRVPNNKKYSLLLFSYLRYRLNLI